MVQSFTQIARPWFNAEELEELRSRARRVEFYDAIFDSLEDDEFARLLALGAKQDQAKLVEAFDL